MKILVFGNPLVKEDSLAIKLIPELKKNFPKIEFIHIDPTENLEEFGKDLIIIDVVKGIKEPVIINDLNKLKTISINSMHDFDLAYNLKLLKKVNKINTVIIFGLPFDIREKKALSYVKRFILDNLPHNSPELSH